MVSCSILFSLPKPKYFFSFWRKSIWTFNWASRYTWPFAKPTYSTSTSSFLFFHSLKLRWIQVVCWQQATLLFSSDLSVDQDPISASIIFGEALLTIAFFGGAFFAEALFGWPFFDVAFFNGAFFGGGLFGERSLGLAWFVSRVVVQCVTHLGGGSQFYPLRWCMLQKHRKVLG